MTQSKVLVVDDTKNIVQLIRYNLERNGFSVLEANDGEAAVESAIKEIPDLIILDVNMPKKNGFEVCRELRANLSTSLIPIIIVSSRSAEYDKLTGFEFGADEYLTKPFRVDELMGRVRTLMNGKRVSVLSTRDHNAEKTSDDNGVVSFGDAQFDSLFQSKLMKGSNVLLTGPYGSGKSTLARKFIEKGVVMGEAGLYVSVEDPSDAISEKINSDLGKKPKELEKAGYLNIVSVMNIAGIKPDDFEEVFKSIIQAGVDIGQSITAKKGGRRVIDSLSGLLVNYGEAPISHFISQIIHTSTAFGGVTTLFTLDEGAVSSQQSANIKSYMDAVVETKIEKTGVYAQVVSVKWIEIEKSRVKIWSRI